MWSVINTERDNVWTGSKIEKQSVMYGRNGEGISQHVVDVQSFNAFGFIKDDGVDGAPARIFSSIESCSAMTLDENVSNDYAGFSYSRVSVEELETDNCVGSSGSGHACQCLAQRGGGVQTVHA